MTSTAALANLAALMGLTPTQAVALPTVIEVAAAKTGLTEITLIMEAAANEPLRDYLAEICITTMSH